MEKPDSGVVKIKSVTFASPLVTAVHLIPKYEESEHSDAQICEPTCSSCLRTPLGDPANTLVKCSSCDSNLCEECYASSRRSSNRRNVDAHDDNDNDCTCSDCGITSSTHHEVSGPRTDRFSRIWHTSKCPVCRHRVPKDRPGMLIQCSRCDTIYCKWCNAIFPSTDNGTAGYNPGGLRCGCKKFTNGVKFAARAGLCALGLPFVAAGVILLAPGAIVAYTTASSEKRARVNKQFKKQLKRASR